MKARKIQIAGFVFLLGMLVFSIPGCGRAAEKPDAGGSKDNRSVPLAKSVDDGVSPDPETAQT